jgi:hypothetical protein
MPEPASSRQPLLATAAVTGEGAGCGGWDRGTAEV